MLMEIGKPLPDWSLAGIFSDEVPLKDDFIGKPLLILFFYMGCPGCLGRAIPFANRVVVERGESIQVLGIHTNYAGPEYPPEEMAAARNEFFIRFPIFYDTGISATFHDYKGAGTPHWILVNADGIVVDSIFGSDPNRALLRLDYHIIEMLGEI